MQEPVKAKKAAVKARAPKALKKVVSVSTTTVIHIVSDSAVVVSDSEAIAKPWWARKTVSETAVEIQ